MEERKSFESQSATSSMPISRGTLEAIRTALLSDATNHESTKRVLEHLPEFEEAGDDAEKIRHVWDIASPDLARLLRDGVMDRKPLDDLATEVLSMTLIPKGDLEAFKLEAGPFLSGMHNDAADVFKPGVSEEYREAANVAFTYRAMALHPRRVMPPGKNLSTLFMSQPDKKSEEERAREKDVTNIVKRAYWDAALEQISSPSADAQLARIKTFYTDLHEALQPWIPPTHPLMVALHSPPSPSPNPLVSALKVLYAAIKMLRTVSAAAHDHAIEAAATSLQSLDVANAPREELAKAYIEGMKFTLDMAERLFKEYESFTVKYGDESNIKALLRGSARDAERQALLGSFGEEKLRTTWREWRSTPESVKDKPWTDKLVDAVATLIPLQNDQEILPPILRTSRLDIAEAQTLLMGILIAASLRTLVPALPPTRLTTLYNGDAKSLQTETAFMERLWHVIGVDPYASGPSEAATVESMAAEVIHLWKQRHPDHPDVAAKEKELLEISRRLIDNENDPVRVLLQKRVTEALKERLSHPIIPVTHDPQLAAGRSFKPVKRLKPGKAFAAEQAKTDLVVPGFTDAVLKVQLRKVSHLLRLAEGWVQFVWHDIST